jgi:hypothetical protein
MKLFYQGICDFTLAIVFLKNTLAIVWALLSV